MNHKYRSDRNQMFMCCPVSAIANDSFVRVVDAFVDAVDLNRFGFAHVECQEVGTSKSRLQPQATTDQRAHVRDHETTTEVYLHPGSGKV